MAEIVLEFERTMRARPDRVFDLILDARRWPEWSPLGSAEIERASPDGPGGVGEIRVFKTGRITSREEVRISERPRRFSYGLLTGLDLVDYVAMIELEPDGEGTRLRWRSSFRARYWGSGWFFRRTLGDFIGRLLDGLVVEAER